jgi:hypothetical protein
LADSHEAIADNSTLSNFARSGHLGLLQKIFLQGVWTTAEVVAELERGAGKYPELLELLNAQSSWLKVVEELSPLRLANTEGLHDPSRARQIKADMEAKARFRVKDPEP